MNIIQIALLMLVILLAFPAGLLLAHATREELRGGRRAFIAIIIASFIVILISLFLGLSNQERLFITTGMLSILIITCISLKKSYSPCKITPKKAAAKKKRKLKKINAKR